MTFLVIGIKHCTISVPLPTDALRVLLDSLNRAMWGPVFEIRRMYSNK